MADYRGAPSLPPRPSYSVALSGGAARRGGMTAWEVSGLAVGVTQLVVAVLYALAMADMPQLVHVRGLGDALFYAATGAGLLGLAASWLRSRPVLNLHLMAGVLALVLAIIFTTNTKRDTTTFCNILMLDANLHTADQHMRQMHNNGVMENLASRLQELDKQILEIPDIAHATHKSNEEQQNMMTTDYGILHKKISDMRRHATVLQEQVVLMAAKINKANNGTDVESTLKGDVPEEHQRHLDKLQDIFKAAEEVLKGTELPKMQQGKQGRLDPSLNMQPEVFLPLLVNLTQAKDEIAAIEEVLHPELGGERITNMGKAGYFDTWRSSERRMAYELDDDYSIMDDYLDYNELLRWPGPPHRCRRLAETAGIGH
mmetsp:Transcript_19348/g.49691  ORF Transcript_19348/g.49691 Transcript_19348/m.49691 type:complete len:372 (-) Transcript_19348:762-1877(-)|eukprot:jgi/Tetstr1/425617/TSEL_016037.t1